MAVLRPQIHQFPSLKSPASSASGAHNYFGSTKPKIKHGFSRKFKMILSHMNLFVCLLAIRGGNVASPISSKSLQDWFPRPFRFTKTFFTDLQFELPPPSREPWPAKTNPSWSPVGFVWLVEHPPGKKAQTSHLPTETWCHQKWFNRNMALWPLLFLTMQNQVCRLSSLPSITL